MNAFERTYLLLVQEVLEVECSICTCAIFQKIPYEIFVSVFLNHSVNVNAKVKNIFG